MSWWLEGGRGEEGQDRADIRMVWGNRADIRMVWGNRADIRVVWG